MAKQTVGPFIALIVATARNAGLKVSDWVKVSGNNLEFLKELYALSNEAVVRLCSKIYRDGILEVLLAKGSLAELGVHEGYALLAKHGRITEEDHVEAIPPALQAQFAWSVTRRWLEQGEWYLEPSARDALGKLVSISFEHNPGFRSEFVDAVGILAIVESVPRDKTVAVLKAIRDQGATGREEFDQLLLRLLPPSTLIQYVPQVKFWEFLTTRVFDTIPPDARAEAGDSGRETAPPTAPTEPAPPPAARPAAPTDDF